jgi:subtilisin family serine protease
MKQQPLLFLQRDVFQRAFQRVLQRIALKSSSLLTLLAIALWSLPHVSEPALAQSPTRPNISASNSSSKSNAQPPLPARVLTDGYTLTVPGKLQSDGTYSLARVVTIARPAEGTYLPRTIMLKTKRHVVIETSPTGKQSSGVFQSSAIASVLDAYSLAGIRPIAPEFNRGARTASDDYGIGRIAEVRFSGAVDVIALCRDLNNNPDVEYAEPVYTHQLHQDQNRILPNDPMFAMQFALERIQASRAWQVVRGDSTMVIAIVDSGVDWEHEDLAANIWTNPGESGNDAQGRDKRSNGVDDDRNGKIDDWHGWDFTGAITDAEAALNIFREDNDPKARRQSANEEDVNLHGSHVAGLASAVTNNGKGVAGAAYNCFLLPVKCGSDRTNPNGSVYRGYEGILYAAMMGAQVINNSWGGTGAFSLYNQDIVNTATALGSLVVSSAGNDGTLMDNTGFPASYDNVLAVGNSTIEDLPRSTANGNASGSSFGIKTDVWAPGSSVQSTYLNNNQYGPLTGTSMSSPLVAGIAALVRKQHPDWSPAQVTQQIRMTSDNVFTIGAVAPRGNPDDRPPLFFGRMNAFRAVTANRVLNQGDDQIPGVITAGASVAGADGVIDSYQPHRLVLRVQNVLSNASELTVTLTPIDGRGTVLSATRTVGTLNTMQQKNVIFDLQLNATASGSGTTDYLVTYRSKSASGSNSGGSTHINYDRLTVAYRLAAVRQPLLVSSAVLDYGTVNPAAPATQSVSVRNLGNQDMTLRAPVFSGANAAAFSLVTPFDSVLIAAGGSRTFPVRFNPATGVTTGVTTGSAANAGERTAAMSFSGTSSGVASGTAAFARDYSFELVATPYGEFTDGTRLGGGAAVDDNDYETAIGFPFRVGAGTFERMTVSSNGYIVFAPSGPISGQNTTVLTPFFARGATNAAGWVAAFSSDLQCRTDGDISVRVTGTAPNRVCTVQWRRMSFWEAGSDFAPDANLNFQIRLYERTNRIEQAYGTMSFAGAARGANIYMGLGQIGLLGTSDDDFQTRRVRVNLSGTGTAITRTSISNTWITPAEGGLASFAEVSPSTAPPATGLVYRWNYEASTPVARALERTTALRGEVRSTAVASSTTTTLSFATATSGTVSTRTLVIRNIGSAALTTTRLAIVTSPTVPAGTFALLDSAISSPLTPLTIAPGDSARVQIRFAPSTSGTFAAGFRLEGNTETLQIPIIAFGSAPVAVNSRILVYGFTGGADFPASNILSRFDRFPQNAQGAPTPVTIGSVRVATDIELRSRGTEPVTITGATLIGNATSEFILTQPQFPITLRPGQVQALRVEYRPLVAGEKSVELRLESNAQQQGFLGFSSTGAIPRFIRVNTRTAAEIFPATGEDVRDRFPLPIPTTEVGERSTVTVRLQHSTAATAPARITAVQVRGEAAGDYVVDSAFVRRLPLRLAPGDSASFQLTFRPSAPEARRASLVLTADGTPAEEDVSLAGLGLERRFFVNRNARSFTAEVGTTSASQTISFFGDANQAVTITGTPRIEGRDSAEFILTLPTPFNRRLPLDSAAIFRVVFAPKSLGQKQAQFTLQSDVGPIVVNLIGRAITVTSATLRTETVSAAPGTIVEVPIILSDRRGVSAGTQVVADLRVNATLLVPVAPTPSGVVVDGQRIIPLSLTFNGDSVLTTLRFRVQLGNELSSALQLGAAANTETAATPLSLNSGRFTLTNLPASAFSRIDYEQFQNRDIAIPVTFSNRQSIPVGAPMTTTMDYNASLLDLQSGAAMSATPRSFNATTGLTTLRFVIPNGTTDSTVTLNFRAAIGNAPSTALSLVNTFTSGLRVVSFSSATFTVKGLNQAGGTRLYYSSKTTLKVLASSPNPASDAVSVRFALAQPDEQTAVPVVLTVADVFGRVIATKQLGNLLAGEHTVSVPLSQLASGTYFLTLTGAGAQATTRVQALR